MGEYQYRLISLMEDRGLSQSQLAKISGVSKSSLNRYVNGSDIPASSLASIANALGCTTDEILGLSSIVTTSGERDIISKFRSLDDDGKKIVVDLIERLVR